MLRPGQRVRLRGYAQEAYGMDTAPRYINRIDSASITHRYDLVLADPESASLPFEDANGDYVPVPSQVATVDRETGEVRARRGTSERTYAIAVLSVGDKVAGLPFVFEPRRSFVAERASVTLPPAPRPARAPAGQPPLRAASAPPPPPPPVSPPQQPQGLAFGTKSIVIAPVSTVQPPAPPPVNPAPPSGARREAKQRQAATAKSEEGARKEAAGEATEEEAPYSPGNRASMTRHEFTAARRTGHGQSWSTVALYGGGLTAAALALALAAGTWPRPRSRRRALPAPARSEIWRRRL